MSDTRKISAHHLKRKAYLYIRQSTVFQTEQNRESTERQYRFREQAISLGWHPEQVVVIDDDLGRSAAEADQRPGFQRLVADVSLGLVGIVLSLEVSRLARNSSDWHRLLELCVLGDTLILDEDGLYDPNLFNDRLILGLRGTMSEAELHVLRGRLEGGKLNKARRGELRTPLPVGLLHDSEGRIVLDPDREVQAANAFEARRTDPSVLKSIEAWALTQTDEQIAARLNTEGKRTGSNLPFTYDNVHRLRKEKKIAGFGDHLRQTGMRTTKEITRQTGIAESTLRQWRQAGYLRAVRVDHKHWLYEVPTQNVLERIAEARSPK